MKKPYLLLVATALLTLAGCRSQPTPDDSKKTTDSTSDVTGTEASTSLFCPVFPQALLHHFFLQATVKEAEGEPLEIRVALSEDHATISSTDDAAFYEKTATGGYDRVHLDETNEVIHEPQLGSFADQFPNPFAAIKDSTDLINSEGKLTELGEAFADTIGLDTTLTFTQATLEFEGEGAKVALVTDSATQVEMVFSSDASSDLRLSPLPETEESKQIDKTLGLLEPKNYTATLTQGGKEKAKVEVQGDRLLFADGTSTKGYVKTESGYKTLNVDGGVVSQDTVTTDAFGSLLPDFDFSGAIFQEEKLTYLVKSADVLSHFAFKPIAATFKNKTIQSLKATDTSLVLTFDKEGSVPYVLTIDQIGTTKLSVDLDKVTILKTWESEAPKIDSEMKQIMDTPIPYWDCGYTWFTEGDYYNFVLNAKLLETGFEAKTADEAEAQFNAYAQLLRDKGFVELNQTDLTALSSASFYPIGDYDINGFAHDRFFLAGSMVVEICYGDTDYWTYSWDESPRCYLCISPDVRQ